MFALVATYSVTTTIDMCNPPSNKHSITTIRYNYFKQFSKDVLLTCNYIMTVVVHWSALQPTICARGRVFGSDDFGMYNPPPNKHSRSTIISNSSQKTVWECRFGPELAFSNVGFECWVWNALLDTLSRVMSRIADEWSVDCWCLVSAWSLTRIS